MNRKLLFRLTPLYIATFFQAFNLWYAVEKIFMRSIGFDDVAIGIAAALFTAVIILLEAPSGILADRWSRKGVLIIASVAMMVTSLLCGLSDSVLWYTLSIMCIGVYFAMYSGTYEAVIYDTILEENDSSDNYQSTFGKFQIVSSLALISGSVVGGFISSVTSPQIAYFATIPVMLLSIIALLYFKEPRLHKTQDERTLARQILDTAKMVGGKDAARSLVITIVLLTASTALLFEYAQLWYLALAVPVVWFGVFYGSLNAAVGISGFIGQFAVRKPRMIAVYFGLVIIAGTSLMVEQIAIIIIAQLALQTFLIVLTVIMTKRFHDTIPSQNRAGAGSAIGTLSQILAVALYLIFGFVSNVFSIFATAWIFVILVCVAAAVVYNAHVFTSKKEYT